MPRLRIYVKSDRPGHITEVTYGINESVMNKSDMLKLAEELQEYAKELQY